MGCRASAAVEHSEYSACGAVATTRSPVAKPFTPSPAASTIPVVEYPMALGLTGPSIT